MSKIVDKFKIGKTLILVLDSKDAQNDFSKVEIDGKIYDVSVAYDIPNSFAIECDDISIGNTVKFISHS